MLAQHFNSRALTCVVATLALKREFAARDSLAIWPDNPARKRTLSPSGNAVFDNPCKLISDGLNRAEYR